MKSLKESIFRKNKKEYKGSFNKDQSWEYWCAQIIKDLVHAFKEYNDKNLDKNLQDLNKEIQIRVNHGEEYPENFDKEIIKIANKNSDFWDTLHCLYTCWNNGDFSIDDISKAGYTKVKFYGT